MHAKPSPSEGIALDREQRVAVYDEVLNHLSAIGDVHLMIERGEYETARRLRREFEDDLRLLDDIGWGRHEPAETFALTMPADQLARTFWRLHADATGGLHTYATRTKDEERVAERQAVACSAYGAVLAQLTEQHGLACSPGT